MKSLSRLLGSALLCLSLFASIAVAQAEKIAVRIVPKPNQTATLKIGQDVEIEIRFEGEMPPQMAAMNPMKMLMKTQTTITQRTSTIDGQGRLEMELTYNKIESEMTMNGQTIPLNLNDELAGKKIRAVYDQKGELVDFLLPPDDVLPKETFTELLKSIYGSLPTEPMAIGDAVTIPLTQNFPLPVPGAGTLNLVGDAKVKLTAITKEGATRIATFDQTVTAKMANTTEVPGPTGQKAKMKLDFKMGGSGNCAVNLDKGLVKTSEMVTKLEGKMTAAENANASPMPNLSLVGTIKATVVNVN